MDFVVREDRILSVHQLIEQNSKRIRVIRSIPTFWVLFELRVIEIWNISSVVENLVYFFVHWDGFSNFRNAVFDVNVFDVEHIDGLEGRLLDGLDRLEKRVEEELNMFFF